MGEHMHAKHARQNVMIDAITWLFAVGAIITAFNFFITEASGIVIQHMIFGEMTVSEVISVSGWSIFLCRLLLRSGDCEARIAAPTARIPDYGIKA